jgi:hypothetical protein
MMGTTVKNEVSGEESGSLARIDQRLEVLVTQSASYLCESAMHKMNRDRTFSNG